MSDRIDLQTPVAAPRHTNRNVALLLIAAGVLIVARQTSGLLGDAFWSVVWPLALIAVGADLVTEGQQRRRIMFGTLIGLVVCTPIVGGARFFDRQPAEHATRSTSGGSVGNVQGIDQVEAKIDITAGNIGIHALPADSAAVAATANGEIDYDTDDQAGQVAIERSWGDQNVQLDLTRQKPLDVEIDIGAGNAEALDFSDLQLKKLNLDLGAGNSEIMLPKQGVMEVDVSGAVGNVTLHIPDSLAARIEIDEGLGNLDVSDRFQKQDDVYVTKNYQDDASNRATIKIDRGGGNITIR